MRSSTVPAELGASLNAAQAPEQLKKHRGQNSMAAHIADST
jgi:hypothetical protein